MRNTIVSLLLAGALACGLLPRAAAQTADPVSVLKSDAPFKDKEAACRKLSLQSTPAAVPVLAALLGDEKLSHMARYALEPMPYPEAGKALRDALGATSGRLKVGVISSLTIRQDQRAVPEFIKLLSDADPEVVQAVAKALGVIVTPEGEKALEQALAHAAIPSNTLNAVCDGLLACAEQRALKKQRGRAVKIYDRLLQIPNAPHQVQTAALRGAVLNRGDKQGLPLLMERLRGESEADFASALRVSRELRGHPKVTSALVGLLPSQPAARKIRILEVFGDGDGKAAGAGTLAEANEGPEEVRVAALRALTRMHYRPALELAARLSWTEEGNVAEAARNALAHFPGKEGDAALQVLLRNEQAKARRVAVELIGQGGLEAPGALLLKVGETDADESVRVAALEGLHDYAGIEEMPGLLSKTLHTSSPPEMQAAESALAALCERQKQMPGGIAVQKAVYGALPDGPSVDVLDKVSRMVKAGASSVDASNGNFGEPAPGIVKKLRVDYTENGTLVSKTVAEGETLKFATGAAPAAIVDAFCGALEQAQGEAKLVMLRLLGPTGSPKAFDIVRAVASTANGTERDMALRTLCAWPTPDALPTVMELTKTAPDEAMKVLALRGAVRLLGAGTAAPADTLSQYVVLMALAHTPEEKKLVLSGLAQVPHPGALELAFAQFNDASVKAEAVQAAIAIAQKRANPASDDKNFFNGADLAGWQGNTKYWRFEDGAIVGQSTEALPQSEFLWSGVEVSDFYLAFDILLEPNTGNSGVQFRSKKVDEHGQALGYQADAGKDCWGRLYHEHGRGKLDWTEEAEKVVKPGQWNHYEILAVGPAIWTAINGTLGVAYLEPGKDGERSGQIAIQLHAGLVETVRCRFRKLVHNPRIELEGIGSKDLIAALEVSAK